MQIAPPTATPATATVMAPAPTRGGAEDFLAVLASLRGTPDTSEPAKVAETAEPAGDTEDPVEEGEEPDVVPVTVQQLPADAPAPEDDSPRTTAKPQAAAVQAQVLPQASVADMPAGALAEADPVLPAEPVIDSAPTDPAPAALRVATPPVAEKPAIAVGKTEPAPPATGPSLQTAPDTGTGDTGAEGSPARHERKPLTRLAEKPPAALSPDPRPAAPVTSFTPLDTPPPGAEDKAPALSPVTETSAPQTAERITHAPRLHPTAETGVSRQIAMAIERTGEGQTEIRLDPAELGRVRLTLHATDQAVTVAIHADRPETLDLIRRNIDSLTQDLRALGYSDIGLNLGSGSGNGQARSSPQAPLFDGPGALPADDPVLPRPATARSGGLDLRL